VRNRLLTAPWWVLSLVYGLAMALVATLIAGFGNAESWWEAVVSGGLGGVLFGTLVGPVLARSNRRLRDAAGDVPRDQLHRVVVLARRGPVPEDPRLRQAARRVALDQRQQVLAQRWWTLPFIALVITGMVWGALSAVEPAWVWWVMAAFFTPLAGSHLVLPRQLARRAELLADPPV
jgi:hypothetical protein